MINNNNNNISSQRGSCVFCFDSKKTIQKAEQSCSPEVQESICLLILQLLRRQKSYFVKFRSFLVEKRGRTTTTTVVVITTRIFRPSSCLGCKRICRADGTPAPSTHPAVKDKNMCMHIFIPKAKHCHPRYYRLVCFVGFLMSTRSIWLDFTYDITCSVLHQV